jgi:AbrB family looped-hinge helix DNA binding protein
MTRKVTLDKAGRVALPKPMRDELQLGPGEALEVENQGEEITLRPVRGNAPLRKKDGIWVYRAGEPLAESVVEDTRRQVRRERDLDNTGKSR